MDNDAMRAKARATFGKEFMDVMRPQAPARNEAVALQQRANARPIPTYKVGGAVKSPPGPTPAEREASRKQDESLKKAKVTSGEGKVIGSANRSEAGKYADGGKVADQRIAARLAAGNYKKGGGVKTSSDTARKLATEMGGMKKGGKAKNGLAVMIAVGKPMKRAVGGVGKVRKGQAPIKRMNGGPIKGDESASKLAKGGAGKVRKGMMSPEGEILQAVKPKKGLGGM